MREVVYHQEVPGEAQGVFRYYERVSPQLALADDFWEELIRAIRYAREFPERHHFDPNGLRRASLRRFPIHFLFPVFETHTRVTTIRHDRQNPKHGSKRR